MSQQFEYKIVQGATGMTGAKIRAGSEEILNSLGRQGWEAYHVKTDDYPTLFYMKRAR